MQIVYITLILTLSATTNAWIKPGFWLPLPGLATVGVAATTTGPTTTTMSACPTGCCIGVCAGAACGATPGTCATGGTYGMAMMILNSAMATCTAAVCTACPNAPTGTDVACP